MNQAPKNLITDVSGILVGNAADARVKSGVTVVLCETPAVASVHVMGGAPGTRETDLLAPEQTVGGDRRDRAFGRLRLRPRCGGQRHDAPRRRGTRLRRSAMSACRWCRPRSSSISSTAATRTGARRRPTRRSARAALAAVAGDFALGTAGAGTGATTVNLKGGLGSASMRLEDGTTVGALVAVNALGQATFGDGRHFWAAPFEVGTRVRRPRLAGRPDARGGGAPPQGAGPADREHDHRRRRHRRDADQGRGQAARDHDP